MKLDMETLRHKLFEAKDGSQFWKLKDELLKNTKQNREMIIEILGEYVKVGKIKHMRSFILPDVIKLINEGEDKYSSLFEYGLADKELAYWSIQGLLKTAGSKAYPKIIDVVQNPNLKLETRGKAIKQLAIHSGQKFDRNLPSDPGHWMQSDLRVAEVIEWANSGFPKGLGYQQPQSHPSLDNPSDEFGAIISALDKKLAKLRKEQQDLAYPTNWLTLGDTEELNRVLTRWTLPSLYVRLLRDYSPLNVFIEGRKFLIGFELFGASNLINGQIGYSHSEVGELLPDWPQELLVIGQDNADPFCLDLAKSNGRDAPIVKGTHGEGQWKFKNVAPSLKEFLQKII